MLKAATALGSILCVGIGCLDGVVPERPTAPATPPVEIAQLEIQPGTPCIEGLRELYAANCTGQTEQEICRTFAEAVTVFSVPEQGIHCNVEELRATQFLATQFAVRAESRVPPQFRERPDMHNRVNDQRLFLLDGFNQGLIEHGTPRPGRETEARTLAQRYRPTSFAAPIAR